MAVIKRGRKVIYDFVGFLKIPLWSFYTAM